MSITKQVAKNVMDIGDGSIKLSKYQKRYIWNHQRATKSTIVSHILHIAVAEMPPHPPVQCRLSAKHLIPMDNYTYTTECNEEELIRRINLML